MAKSWSFAAQGWATDKGRWKDLFQHGYKRFATKMQNDIRAEVSRLASGGDLDIRDAQSWNRETHPNGPGPSQLVKRIDYDKDDGNLTVTYRDGFRARYEMDNDRKIMGFAKADSKGRWALKNLWPLPYEEV